jgi:hypothetical protein
MKKLLISVLLCLAFHTVASSAQQVDPSYQISWPQNCTAGLVYSPDTNTCVAPSATGDVNPLSFAGSDLGAQINAAYSSCTAGPGCRITIPPGQFNVSTPVVIATKGVNATIECSGTSTTLTWTPTSGTMFTFATNGAGTGNGWASGIRYCNLANATSGTTATAVQFGVSASDTTGRTAQGAFLDNVQVNGFNEQLDYESNAWNITVLHSEFINFVTNAVFTNPSATNMGESLNWVADTFANSLDVWKPSGFLIQNGGVIGNCIGCNFDDVEVVSTTGTLNLTNAYFEDPGPTNRTTPWFAQGGVTTLTGFTAAEDEPTATVTQPCITVAGSLTWDGGILFGGGCATAVLVQESNGHTFIAGAIDADVNVPLIINDSTQAIGENGYATLQPDNPTFAAEAVKAVNPSPTTNDHFYTLEQVDGGVTYDVFLEQLGSSDPNNPNGFEIAMQESGGGTFFNPIQIDPTGGHVGLHGVPDTAVNNHLYGTNEVDHITNGTGIQSFAVPVCAITAGAVGNSCNVTVTFASASPAGVPEPDAAYRVTCQAVAGSGTWTVGNISTLTATSFVIPAVALTTTATATGGSVHCTLTHQ